MKQFNLETPILNFPGETPLTIRECFAGIQIWGGVGSGKTTGSGRALALRFLAEGFGGLVLTCKTDEKDSWVGYCRLSKRSKDLIILEPEGAYAFNFLQYISKTTEDRQGFAENIFSVLKTVIAAGQEKDKGKSEDAFWEGALDTLIISALDLILLAYGEVTIERLFAVVRSIPKPNKPQSSDKPSAFQKAHRLAQKKVVEQEIAWQKTIDGDTRKILAADDEAYTEALYKAVPNARTFGQVHEFFMDNYKDLSEKTRSIIEFMFTGFLFRLMREPVFSMFCGNHSNFRPEDCFEGKIILVNLPTKRYDKIGRDCQILFKYIWQKAVERRDVTKSGRPLFLFADEAQTFIHEHDAEYQATARSSMISTVYISQNLANYFRSMGGEKSQHKVMSLLGTLSTQIYHANADLETNRHSSEMIGDGLFTQPQVSMTMSNNSYSAGQTVSTKIERRVRAEDFTTLRTGSPLNNLVVEAYIVRQGAAFRNGENFKKISFKQNFIP